MDAEPRGHTIDGDPWEEPRPPHLPDAPTGVSPWVVAFLILAGIQVLAGWLEWVSRHDQQHPIRVLNIVVLGLPGFCSTLLGAALFYRHPDALRRLPLLVFGVALLTIVALLDLWNEPLTSSAFLPEMFPRFLEGGFGVDESTLILSGIYTAAMNVVMVFGLLYLARGLDGARRSAPVVLGRILGIALTIVALASAGVSLEFVLTYYEPGDIMIPLDVMALVMRLISALAWSYLFVIAIGGWLAGERPRAGWLLVALAAGIEIAIRTLLDGLVNIPQWAFTVIFVAAVANWVLLLRAFVVGVPSTATPDRPAATTPGSAAG